MGEKYGKMGEFKVGDKVKVKRGLSSDSALYAGTIQTIVTVESSHYMVHSGSTGGIWPNELEAVEVAVPATIKYSGIDDTDKGWGFE